MTQSRLPTAIEAIVTASTSSLRIITEARHGITEIPSIRMSRIRWTSKTRVTMNMSVRSTTSASPPNKLLKLSTSSSAEILHQTQTSTTIYINKTLQTMANSKSSIISRTNSKTLMTIQT